MASNSLGSDIRIIGPRQSGKTTYLGSLICFPHEQHLLDFPKFIVESKNPATNTLKEYTENTLKQGGVLSGTLKQEVDKYETYNLKITVFTKKNTSTVINLITKDYPGEFFQNMAEKTRLQQENIERYLDDLCKVTGWMILVSSWLPEQDSDSDANSDSKVYSSILNLYGELINKKKQNHRVAIDHRVAVVMSKCERGEIWSGRFEPEEDLFAVRLPKTYQALKKKLPSHSLKFFACSSFGILNDRPDDFNPRPNYYCPGDSSNPVHYIRNRDQWTPFGLFSPIYWLATGKTLPHPKF